MANVYINLPVTVGDGVGAWVDVSGQGPERTVSVDGGPFGGSLTLEGSNDGQVSAAPAIVGPFIGPTFVPQTFVQAFNFLRVRRVNSGGVGTPTVNVGAPASSTNAFGAVAVPNIDGVGAATNISGGGDVNTIQVAGAFTGQILIETSTDGVSFSPTLIFTDGGGVGQQLYGVLKAVRVRRRGVTAGAAPAVSVGSQATSGGGGGPVVPETLAVAYTAGAVAADQTMVISDANGGGIVVDAHNNGSFAGATNALRILGNTNAGAVAPVRVSGAGASGEGIRFDGGATKILVSDAALALEGFAGATIAGNGLIGYTQDNLGNVGVGKASAQLAPGAVNGFLCIPSSSSAPVGVPAAAFVTGGPLMAPITWHNPSLWVWDQGTTQWVEVTSSFGSDTIVQLPNSAATPVNALELLLTLTNAGVGTEASKWVIRLLNAGAQVNAVDIRPAQILLPNGVTGAPAFAFQAATGTGMWYDPAATAIAFSVGGTYSFFMRNSQFELLDALGTIYFAIGQQESVGRNNSGGITVASNTHDISIGPDGAVATNATHGFLDLPSTAGVPTGVATPRAGKVPEIIDTTDGRLYLFYGAAWHYVKLDDYTATATRIPFGDATAGKLTDLAGLTYVSATSTLNVGTTVIGAEGSIRVNAGSNGSSIGGGVHAGVYVADPNANGQANVAVDDYFFGQELVGYSNLGLTNLAVGVGTGNTLSLSYLMDRAGAHTDAMTIDGTTGTISMGTGIAGRETVTVLQPAGADPADVLLGATAAVAASTHGFPYVATVAGQPTGVQAKPFGAGLAAFAYDSAHTAWNVFDPVGNQWLSIPMFNVTLGAGAGVGVINNLPAGFGVAAKWWNFTSSAGVNCVIPYFTNP